jgi:choloylglycine hydrolase
MPNVIWVDLKNFDLSEGAPTMMFNLKGNFDASGDVSGLFKESEPVNFIKAGGVVEWVEPK